MFGLASQLAWQWGSAVSVGLGTLAAQAVFAQSLGAADFAVLSVVLSLAMIAYVIQNGGYRTLLLRESVLPTPGFPSVRELYAQASGHLWVTTAAMIAALFVAGLAFKWPFAWLACIAIAANASRVLANLISAKLLARQELASEARWQMLSRLIPLAAAAAAALMGTGVAGVLISLLVCQSVMPRWRPAGLERPGVLWPISAPVRLASLRMSALDLFTQVYVRQSTLILCLAAPLDEVGRFALMLRFVEAFSMLIGPLGIIFHNRVRMSGVRAPLTKKLGAGILFGSFAVVAVAFAVQLNAGGDILATLFGEQYRLAARHAPWLLLGAALMVPNLLLGQALIAKGDEGGYMRIAASLAAINLGVCLTLIFPFGASGAAAAMAMTEASLLGQLLWRHNHINAFGHG